MTRGIIYHLWEIHSKFIKVKLINCATVTLEEIPSYYLFSQKVICKHLSGRNSINNKKWLIHKMLPNEKITLKDQLTLYVKWVTILSSLTTAYLQTSSLPCSDSRSTGSVVAFRIFIERPCSAWICWICSTSCYGSWSSFSPVELFLKSSGLPSSYNLSRV